MTNKKIIERLKTALKFKYKCQCTCEECGDECNPFWKKKADNNDR